MRILVTAVIIVICSAAQAASWMKVLALECEVSIPANYKVDARLKGNYDSLRFFDAGDGFGEIRIGEIMDQSALVRLKNTKHLEHLKILVYEYVEDPSITFDVIRSFEQEIVLSSDAKKLTKKIAHECLESSDLDKVAVLKQKAIGCTSTVVLRDDIEAIYNDARIAVYRFASPGEKSVVKGFRVSSIGNRSFLSNKGVENGDLITHICGVPAAEVMKSSNSVCCQENVESSVRLTILKSNKKTIDVMVPKSP